MRIDNVNQCEYCGQKNAAVATVCCGCGVSLAEDRQPEGGPGRAALAALLRLGRLIRRRPIRAVTIGLGLLLLMHIICDQAGWERRRDAQWEYQKKAQILVRGDAEFQKKVCDALLLLEQKVPAKFRFVQQHVCAVKQGDPEGANIYVDPPIVVFSRTVHSAVEWCAACLVHEAEHLRQLRQSQQRHGGGFIYNEVVGAKAETDANQVTAEVLRELGAPADLIVYTSFEGGSNWVNQAVKDYGEIGLSNMMNSKLIMRPEPLQQTEPKLWRELVRLKRSASPGIGGGSVRKDQIVNLIPVSNNAAQAETLFPLLSTTYPIPVSNNAVQTEAFFPLLSITNPVGKGVSPE